MRIVVIETSGASGEIALADAAGLLATQPLSTARKHARDLAPALHTLLRDRDWPPATVNLVLVGLGPGSYTGLRVGIMSAKTFAYATGALVVGVDSMAVLADSAPPDADWVSTIVDAQQGRVYTALFERRSPGDVPAGAQPTAIMPAADWARSLSPGTYVTGPALVRFRDLVPDFCRLAPAENCQPSAWACWSVGMRQYRAGRRDDFWTIEPFYLRPSAAEQKRAERDSGTSAP